MNRLISILATLGLVLGSVEMASAAVITTLFNTGVDSLGTPLPDSTVGDPHYSLLSVPADSTTAILVRTEAGSTPSGTLVNGSYVGDDSLSAWIGPSNDHFLSSPVGTYDYRTTFTLTGLVPATASISGVWSMDDSGIDIFINGVSTGNIIPTGDPPPFLSWHSFNITTGFVAGLNTLDFVVANYSGGGWNPTALRVEMTGQAEAIPEPTALIIWSLLGGCGIALGWLRHRKAA